MKQNCLKKRMNIKINDGNKCGMIVIIKIEPVKLLAL